jgi:very-short-patch-repair endonuclease
MRGQIARNSIWTLVERQHGVVSRTQLLDCGLSRKMIERRLAAGRLHSLWRGVYAVGRPNVTARGWWMGAVLACGGGAVLSHESAARLWGIRETKTGHERERGRPALIDVSVPGNRTHRLRGIRVHRRTGPLESDRFIHAGIPVTTPGRTLIDIATELSPGELEAAVSQADKLGLLDPEALRLEVERHRGADGVASLRRLLDRQTFALTDSELERRFLRLAGRARLPLPSTQQVVSGFRVDFFWPDLRLVVETDGLRYHRTPAQQTKDRRRDQTLLAAGFSVLRFTHAQVAYEADRVVETLRAVSNRVSSDRTPDLGVNRTKSG